MNPPRILVIDDQFARDETERLVFLQGVGLTNGERGGARTSGWAEVVFCSGQREEGARLINDYAVVRNAVDGRSWSLVLLDVQFDSGELDANGRPLGQTGDNSFGLTVLRQLEKEFHGLPILMLTSKRQEEIGESDTPYLSKHKLGAHELKRALLRHGRMEVEVQRTLLELDMSVRADDPATFAAFRQAFIHACADTSVLILGESGTGKEVLARHVHRVSKRANGPFIPVNVAALPKDLVESELFGIGKRVATQVDARQGKFELANGGTLFLDEIGDMPLDVQAKVLRALQERKIVRVGESNETAVDIRLICATSRDLASRVASGEFRSDLLYRVNTVPITMPPLRQRRVDIAPLARGFLNKYSSRQGKEGLSLSAEALALLEEQPFPGNVRELEHLVERLVVTAGHHQVIGRRELLDALGSLGVSTSPGNVSPIAATAAPPLPQAPHGGGALTLAELADIIDRVRVDKDDLALRGIKPLLDTAMRRLYQRLAGAALDRCRNPNSRSLNRQAAMQLLTGDTGLKGKAPARIINEMLDRRQEQPVTEEDLEQLVALWQGKRDG